MKPTPPLLALLLAGCLLTGSLEAQTAGTAPRFATGSVSLPPASAADAPTSAGLNNYRLAPNDLVQIKVFREDDLQATARIAEDGTIFFPLIRTIKIGGRTAGEASE